MGLFDIFSKKKGDAPRVSERELLRLERLVGNKLSQNIDRQEAIETLCAMGNARSAAALLRRFDWMLDPSITDQEEKDACLRGIVAAGEDALSPVRAYCQKAESLTWPIRVLKSIVKHEALQEELLALLDQYDTEYVRNAEPKVQLITELAQHKTDDVRVALEPFLQDASEPVRFATVTSLFEIGDPASVPAFIAALTDEESQRIKNRIAQRLAELGMAIPTDQATACAKALPTGFSLENGRVRALTA
ncbi:MAG TPA: HEAT repeat domain-containing protein [Polyangiaceae bacterium]|nr:HEAT repeat domain-containing protein [Polyangiaceae bacterium]